MTDIVMSIRPEHWRWIADGSKVFEFRRRWGTGHEGKRVWFYATSPRKEVVGYGRIGVVIRDTVDNLTKLTPMSAELRAYLNGLEYGYAIEMRDVHVFSPSLTLPLYRPPQSYRMAREDDRLQDLLELACEVTEAWEAALDRVTEAEIMNPRHGPAEWSGFAPGNYAGTVDPYAYALMDAANGSYAAAWSTFTRDCVRWVVQRSPGWGNSDWVGKSVGSPPSVGLGRSYLWAPHAPRLVEQKARRDI